MSANEHSTATEERVVSVPIPGTRRRERVAENAAATGVALSADEVADLNGTAARIGVHGNRYNEQHMSLVGR